MQAEVNSGTDGGHKNGNREMAGRSQIMPRYISYLAVLHVHCRLLLVEAVRWLG